MPEPVISSLNVNIRRMGDTGKTVTSPGALTSVLIGF